MINVGAIRIRRADNEISLAALEGFGWHAIGHQA